MPDFYFFTTHEADTNSPHFFFNSIEYIRLNKTQNTFSFFLQNENTKEVLATIHFELTGKIAFNLPKAPFGFLETKMLNKEGLILFWKNIENTLKNAGANRIELRSWSAYYSTEYTEPINRFFINQGFFIIYSDHNFHYEVDSRNSLELFRYTERWSFRKCVKAGFVFEKWPLSHVREVYTLLADFRASKNIPLNISEDGLKRGFEQFANKYNVFAVKDGVCTIGVSVCVEINGEILYHFLSATDPAYRPFSPSVMLYEGIYRYAQQMNYRILDLGTASIQGKKQDTLYAFKQHLGATVSLKPTFGKALF